MSVLRWKLKDPYDSNAATNAYTFVRNPASMTSIGSERSIASMTTTAGKVLLREGTTPAVQWSFSGAILHKEEYDALWKWVYGKQRRVYLTDHFGRRLTVVFQKLDVEPKRRIGYYWSHDYTITCYVLAITGPTVTDVGPRP